ncbi:zinc ribbon domain-containing protein [Gammaproteobacteria bacterium]|nr:zinc ribbon domain-containing protein [Gammaproteobacteria bacterium]
MPIYPYACSACGHQFDKIQKFSDEPLVTCPQCAQDTLKKQLAAPAFQLKGTGWYVTDFRDTKKPAKGSGVTKEGDSAADKTDSAGKAKSEASSDASTTSTSDSNTAGKKPASTNNDAA